MIFDAKKYLRRKARLVSGGHITAIPEHLISSSVVARGSVKYLYFNAAIKEKVYTIAGPEFGLENEERPVLIVRALYGHLSSGARWRDHVSGTLYT